MSSRIIIISFIFSLIICLSACSTNSFINSNQQSTIDPIEAIENLKNGTLVFRVPMQQRKLDTLSSIMDRKNLSSKSWIATEMQETEAERMQYFDKMIEELAANYSFSNYLVIADNQYLKLLDGERVGIFLNDKGVIDEQIRLEGDHLILLLDRVSKNKDFIIVGPKGKVIRTPFPNEEIHNGTYRNRGNILNKFFRSFSNIGKSDTELNLLDLEYGIKNLDQILNAYFKNPTPFE